MQLFNKLVVGTLPFVPKGIVRHFSNRYIAGEGLDEALETVRILNHQGFMATLDVLGEDVTRAEETQRAVEEYSQGLLRIAEGDHDANISVKPTQLGLKIDPDLCFENFCRLCREAEERSSFVRLDMEDTSCTEETIVLLCRLREKFDNVGVAIQAYLRRSHRDLDRLLEIKANIRLCKGIYIEPRHLAFKDPTVINRSFTQLLDRLLSGGCYVGIATHDERLVYESEEIVRRLGLDRSQYEFQMLLGVDAQLRQIVKDQGHRLRVYVPYGRDWHAYSTRRLQENPTLVSHVIKAMFSKDRT